MSGATQTEELASTAQAEQLQAVVGRFQLADATAAVITATDPATAHVGEVAREFKRMKFARRFQIRSFGNLRIKSKLSLLVSLFIIGFTVFGVVAYQTLNLVKVNGPIYMHISQGHDLLTDTTPPSMYIIESYMVVMQMLDELENFRDQSQIQALIQRSKILREEYESLSLLDR